MQPNIGDTVTVREETTVEVGDLLVRLRAGVRLKVLDTRPGAVKVMDGETFDAVWIPNKFLTPTTTRG